MEYILKNGDKVVIRSAEIEDAEQILHVLKTADCETRFLGRNPGELNITVEKEQEMIAGMLAGSGETWLLSEYNGKVVGHCFVGFVRNNERYRHRANVAFALLKEYWGLGIGGKMMEGCIDWCEKHGVTQIELDVVKENERALRMYQKYGFEIVGTIPKALRYEDGTYADEYLMVMNMNPLS